MGKIYCVVSHTHWDREWYKPFECFRMQLCELINNLFNIIDQYPSYIFHLDAQTIVLEDYLEIYPENRPVLEKYIKSGNIIVGPWYLQNDYYLTSGEATIRNLLVGKELSEQFGACGKVGYSPDQFGNISQLPRILNGFGIDNFVFARGFEPYETDEKGEKHLTNAPCEFIWEGADQSELFAVYMEHWYNNAQRFSADIDKSTELLKEIEKSFEATTCSPYLLLMNGVDHLEAQEDLFPILDKLNKGREHNIIKQVSLYDYINNLRNYVEKNNIKLPRYRGELRHGGDSSILQGTLSSRSYLKIANVKAQTLLENYIEPLYSMLTLCGFEDIYPRNYMRYLWKLLMQNHPHDSICGCSRDEVHRHMEDRFLRINEIADTLINGGMELAAYHNAMAISDKNAYSIAVANTCTKSFDGIVNVTVRFPENENVNNFIITDKSGRNVEFGLISRRREMHDFFSAINLPGRQHADVFEIYLPAEDIKPMSFGFFKVIPCEGKLLPVEELKENHLENEHLRVTVSNRGNIDILCKDNGRIIKNCILLEDRADKGDSYNFVACDDTPITSDCFVPEIKIIKNNRYRHSISVRYNMELPAFYDFEKEERSKEKKTSACELILSLDMNSRYLTTEFKIDNRSCDHRLRLLVNSDITANEFEADIPFDIITHRDEAIHPQMIDVCYPNTSFAAINDSEKGLALFTEGSHEVAKINKSSLALTLVRSTGCIVHNTGSQWICPENQCIRVTKGRLALYPYDTDKHNSLSREAQGFRAAPLCCCVPCDTRKLTGGRPAVQDSVISEIFYRDDKYSHIALTDNNIMSVDNDSLVISAFKLAEDGEGIIVRLFNPCNHSLSSTIKISGNIYTSDMDEKIVELIGHNSAMVTLRSKEILTLCVYI